MGRKQNIQLTDAQAAVYASILDYFDEYGTSPSFDDLVYMSGYSMTTIVHKVPELVEYGLITRVPHQGRSISLTDKTLPGFEQPKGKESEPEEEAVMPWDKYDGDPQLV